MVDATHIRVHSQAAGARHKRGANEQDTHSLRWCGAAFKNNRHARQPGMTNIYKTILASFISLSFYYDLAELRVSVTIFKS